jgi:hypothetical protein
VLRFVLAFFAAAAAAEEADGVDISAPSAATPPPPPPLASAAGCDASSSAAAAAAAGTFFQAVDVRALSVRVDYRPRVTVDVSTLASRGGAAAALHAVPWGGVALRLPRVQLGGVPGWGPLAAALAAAWGDDVRERQAHKFLLGVPGVRQVGAAGAGAAQLLAAPVETLRAERRALKGAARGALAVRRACAARVRACLRANVAWVRPSADAAACCAPCAVRAHAGRGGARGAAQRGANRPRRAAVRCGRRRRRRGGAGAALTRWRARSMLGRAHRTPRCLARACDASGLRSPGRPTVVIRAPLERTAEVRQGSEAAQKKSAKSLQGTCRWPQHRLGLQAGPRSRLCDA